jgi:hypothetical protein
MAKSLILFGAGARNRTGTGSPPVDFESTASTSFTTPAYSILRLKSDMVGLFPIQN